MYCCTEVYSAKCSLFPCTCKTWSFSEKVLLYRRVQCMPSLEELAEKSLIEANNLGCQMYDVINLFFKKKCFCYLQTNMEHMWALKLLF